MEETLNELLEAEAEKLTQAARYERSEARQGYRSGHYDRNLATTSGDVTLHMPRLKGISFETAIIERYRRRESSVEEALIEMYLAGVSVRRVEDITEALWGSKVSASTISELNKKAYVNIEAWRNRPLQGGRYPYVYVDGIYLKQNWGGEYENVAVLVAIAVNEDGYREVLGAAEGMKEDKTSWVSFFQWLRGRGLEDVKLLVGDKCMGMLEAVGEVFPETKYQRCMPIGMLVVLDSILNRITRNRAKGRNTFIFIDEIYLLFQHEYSANFLFTLWKRVRKYGAYATGITQNVDDLLQSHTARTMLANSEFIIMLNQASTDRLKLAELLNISDLQMSYITNVEAGHGLIKVGSSLVPFANKFPKNTKLYKLMTTKPGESA